MTHLWHRYLLLWRVIYSDPGLMLLWLTCSWDFSTISAMEHISIHSSGYFSGASSQTWHFWSNKVLGHVMSMCPTCVSPSLTCQASDSAAPLCLLPSRFLWKARPWCNSVTSRPDTRRTAGWLTLPLFSVALSNVTTGLAAFPKHHASLQKQLFLSTLANISPFFLN